MNITDSELEALVAELGLEGDAAGDLVKGLSTARDGDGVPASDKPEVVVDAVEAPTSTSTSESTETSTPVSKPIDTKNDDDTKTDTTKTDTTDESGEQRV